MIIHHSWMFIANVIALIWLIKLLKMSSMWTMQLYGDKFEWKHLFLSEKLVGCVYFLCADSDEFNIVLVLKQTFQIKFLDWHHWIWVRNFDCMNLNNEFLNCWRNTALCHVISMSNYTCVFEYFSYRLTKYCQNL